MRRIDYDLTGELTVRINVRAPLRVTCWLRGRHWWRDVFAGTWADVGFTYCTRCGLRR